jgi:hypothetical protein
LVLILGSGMIGSDVSSGVLQLLFARPVRRVDYVLSRWLATAVLAAGLALIQLIVGYLILAARHETVPHPVAALSLAGQHVSMAFGSASVLVALSSLVPGLGDLALYLRLFLVSGLTQMLGTATRFKFFGPLGDEMFSTLAPQLDLAPLFGGSPYWYDIVSYASTVTLGLLLATLVMNRRELSYASG